MRERDWGPARYPEGTLIDRPRLIVRAIEGRGHALLSGDLEAGLAALAPGAPLLGLHGFAPEGPHALRIARDRALLVTPARLGAQDGWRDGWCATAVDDGWTAVEVEGADAPLVLMQGTSADLAAGSPSAALRFAGLVCLLIRTERGFRLHVERGWLEALLTWLDGA
jgi:sarcosine oxidase gamma subunit